MKKISKKELVWYIIAGVFALAGLILIIFGIVGHALNVPLDKNWIKQGEKALQNAIHIPLDFRMWGLIFFGVGAIIAVITLSAFSKAIDRDAEKTIRRKQRLSSAALNNMEIKPSVVEVPAEEPKNE